MSTFSVISKSNGQKLKVDKINTKEHFHVSGREFTPEQVESIEAQFGSNSFVKEEKVPKSK